MTDQLGKLTITVSKTAMGDATYVQIASPAAMPVNIVLIAGEVVIEDHRAILATPPRQKGKRNG